MAWARVPLLVAALLIALLVAAIPTGRPRSVTIVEEEAVETADALTAIGAFFWLLLLGLVLVIILSFLFV